MTHLDGKVALVSGGGSGIGRAIALSLAGAGATVVIAGRRQEALDTVVAEIQRTGGRAAGRRADLERASDTLDLARWTLAQFDRVDVLVNNAGHASRIRSIEYVPLPEWEAVIAVNLTAPFLLIQALLPGMLAHGEGTIVTISSAAAIRPGLLGGAAYDTAKAGVRNLMRHVHVTLRDRGIRATTILPAEVDTPMVDRRPFVPDAASRARMMKPEDIARVVLTCVTLPPRTVVEEIFITPTRSRDMSADLAVTRNHRGDEDPQPALSR